MRRGRARAPCDRRGVRQRGGPSRRLRRGLEAVQARVNEILGCGPSASGAASNVDALAHAVINGDYGNGEARRERLGADYEAVQRRVNELLA
ncbi:hypothetical protein C1876_06585 [Eggerthella sinensis]|uniref:Cpl-7 lysozyme C-terminal domain-containing protein n=1 Tax=Eggerthella sinensis TaxID=242230 RepID=A0A3N0IYB5_9ACTN|nr:hypothetical protein C1876_06585 [Eggerthella sinensis]RNM41935.1 hypothetical protein DMP09_07415 [Eggerthella sinensis]